MKHNGACENNKKNKRIGKIAEQKPHDEDDEIRFEQMDFDWQNNMTFEDILSARGEIGEMSGS